MNISGNHATNFDLDETQKNSSLFVGFMKKTNIAWYAGQSAMLKRTDTFTER